MTLVDAAGWDSQGRPKGHLSHCIGGENFNGSGLWLQVICEGARVSAAARRVDRMLGGPAAAQVKQRPNCRRSARGASTCAGRDLSVKPGDDFEHYASGNWLKNAIRSPPTSRKRAPSTNLYNESQDAAEGPDHQRARRQQIRRAVQEHHGRGAHRTARDRAAEADWRRSRRSAQGRDGPFHGHHRWAFRRSLFGF